MELARKSSIEHRRTERRPVHIIAMCRHSTLRIPASLVNITRDGCCISTATRSLRAGQHVTIKPQAMGGFTGIVRWVKGGEAGVQFERDLYPPVFDHLLRHYSVSTVGG